MVVLVVVHTTFLAPAAKAMSLSAMDGVMVDGPVAGLFVSNSSEVSVHLSTMALYPPNWSSINCIKDLYRSDEKMTLVFIVSAVIVIDPTYLLWD